MVFPGECRARCGSLCIKGENEKDAGPAPVIFWVPIFVSLAKCGSLVSNMREILS